MDEAEAEDVKNKIGLCSCTVLFCFCRLEVENGRDAAGYAFLFAGKAGKVKIKGYRCIGIRLEDCSQLAHEACAADLGTADSQAISTSCGFAVES